MEEHRLAVRGIPEHLWQHLEAIRAELGLSRSAAVRHLLYQDWQRTKNGRPAA